MESPRPFTPRWRPRVLIVDGQRESLALYAIALSTMGFDVLAAAEGQSAFARASAMSPDIVVTDLVLGEGSGWDLLARLQGEPLTRHIPVVILAPTAHSDVCERARREGCAALIVKPCLPDRLVFELRSLLARYHSSEPASTGS